MKRRKAKDQIRRAERWLSREIETFFISLASPGEIVKTNSAVKICSDVTWLLSEHLRLDSSWPDKERWLDGVTNGQISLPQPDTVRLRGKMVWGLSEDIGGNQWEEPFEAVVRVSKHRRRILSYTLKFGSEEPLSSKLVEFGLYDILAAEESGKDFTGIYRYQFLR